MIQSVFKFISFSLLFLAGAECGSDKDSYYYTPWRAPGSAPVFDACGMAGGALKWGHHGAQYRTSSHAKQGDLGSNLPTIAAGKPQFQLMLNPRMYIVVEGAKI